MFEIHQVFHECCGLQPSTGFKFMGLESLAFIPLALQNLVFPSRSSDTILLFLVAWVSGAACGCFLTALILSATLRRCLLRGLLFALQEGVTGATGGGDRLQRYRH